MSNEPPKDAVTVAVFGSCISRDPLAFFPDPRFSVGVYIARNSMAGLYDPPVELDPAWYAESTKFEQACLAHDFRKDVPAAIRAAKADLLILDFIDERFDLMRVGKSHLSSTGRHLSEGFKARHQAGMRVTPRLGGQAFALWEAGCRRFLREIRAAHSPRRIALNCGKWASAQWTEEGLQPFKEPYASLIAPHNALLERMFAVVMDACPEAKCFRPSPAAALADPDHRWSKEPFHYVPAFYREFMDWLAATFLPAEGDAS